MCQSLTWAWAFILTLVIEALASWGVLRAVAVPAGARWLVGLLVANLTHPLLWLTHADRSLATLLVAELLITLVEAVMWRWCLRPRQSPWLVGVAVSIAANGA